MDQPVTWVDVEAAVRSWARDNVTTAGRRVFFGTSESASYPQIVLRRVGGPDSECLVQFDCWGKPKKDGGTKADAAEVAADLATEVDALARYQTDDVVLHGAVVRSSRWFPDPESDQPRYIVDVAFAATSTAPVGS